MPLSFVSESHGEIAFGFFNIDSDMLLLENYFFFADQFSSWMIDQAQSENLSGQSFSYPVHTISCREQVGDLMGAIHGFHFSGFIGEVYKLFPFPKDPIRFKQDPDGFKTQGIMLSELKKWSSTTELEFGFHDNGTVNIGPFVFIKENFHELIRYVWRGGYPRWKNEDRPDYIISMKKEILESPEAWFEGVFPKK